MTTKPTRPNRPKRWLIGCLALPILLVLLVVGLLFIPTDPNPLGHWRSPEGQRAYEQAYAEAMALLPAPARTLDVPTRFGTVRVYEWVTDQTRAADPVLLVPGYTSGVPMWEDNLPALAAQHPVYALDALGDSGMSIQTVEIKDAADQAAWLDDVIAGLGLPQVHLVSHSFGGWSAANYASRHPQRVASLILLEPVFVFQGIKPEIIIKSIPASLPFLPKSWRDKSLEAISGSETSPEVMNQPVPRMIALGAEHYARRIPNPTQITTGQMQGWDMPVYAALAANSPLHDAQKAVETAKANVERVQVKNWPGATHSLPMEYPQEINAEILEFIERNPARLE